MNLKIKAAVAALAFFLTGCTSNFLDINSNPYEPDAGQMQADGYIISAALSSLASTVISTDVNTAQYTECLMGGTLGGYFADSNTSFTRAIATYNATDNWTNVLLASEQCVPKIYSNLADLNKNTDDPVVLAIAQIMKVAAMHRVTDTYGPIPYSKINSGGELQVGYDSQEVVYDKMFEELNSSITLLTDYRTVSIPPTTDYVYGGNVEKWIKFANSLKLRLAMRIVYANETKAKEMAEGAIGHEVGVMVANSDNAQITNFGDKGNPIYTSVNYNRAADCLTGGDTHVAAEIIAYMNGYKDPRRPAYFIMSEWSNHEFIGLRHGIVIPENSITRRYSGVNVNTSSPLFWMNAAEVAFLRAEAAAIFHFDMRGEAGDFYNEGIRLSFEQWGVSGVESYMADAVNVPEIYVDPYNGVNSYNTTLSEITVAWNEDADKAEKQERIITQKWIANWQLGNEAWADYRRTGYPHIIPATVEGNQSLGVVNSKLGARRMPYPVREYTTNNVNVQQAVSNHLKGADNMATRVWWDCNPAIN